MTFQMPTRQPVEMTAAAQAHFANIANGKIVKLSVEGGGCAGFQYAWRILDQADELYPNDEVAQYDAFSFAVDGASLMFLTGSQVNYLTDITGSHIEIVNPLASAGCGCGESVSFK
jgi:iron-sulfur cluster insertion protein